MQCHVCIAGLIRGLPVEALGYVGRLAELAAKAAHSLLEQSAHRPHCPAAALPGHIKPPLAALHLHSSLLPPTQTAAWVDAPLQLLQSCMQAVSCDGASQHQKLHEV